MKDPRYFQIFFLAFLLAFGVLYRDFSIRPAQIALAFASGFGTQYLFIRFKGLPLNSLLSATITCLGLSILIRADNLWVHPLALCAAMCSKFLIQVRGKHIFNPGNFAIALCLLFAKGAWVSPAQWGNGVLLAAWILILGYAVAQRATRLDISWAFLFGYLGCCALRVLILGQTAQVWLHQCQSGSLLLFSFFMISDPRTSPGHPLARVLYGLLVALAAFAWQFLFFRVNGVFWCLFLLAPLVPILDHFFQAQAFAWNSAPNLRSRHA